MNTSKRRLPLTRLFGLAGVLGGLAQLLLQLAGGDWGSPGTLQYTLYELTNRYMALALLLIALGFVGLYRPHAALVGHLGRMGFTLMCLGWAAMITGTVLEFWVFTHQPYGVLNARAWSWMTVLFGMLVMTIGAALWGWAARRALPRWVTVALLALLPLELAQVLVMQFTLGLLVPTAALSVALGGWLLLSAGTHAALAPPSGSPQSA